MKKGVSFYTFSQDVDPAVAIPECAKAGYDGVELVVSEEGFLNMKSTDKDIANIQKILNDHGMVVSSVGSWNIWDHNLVGENSADAEYAKNIIKKQIDCAQAFGADTILAVPGWVGTPFSPGIVSYDRAYDNAMNAMIELEPYARSAGVSIGIENVWNKFLLSPLEIKRFLEEIGSDYVGAYFDVGNIIYIGYPDQWIRILGSKYIKKLHFCDCRADQAGLGMFVDLFEGDVDFHAVMQAIKDIGYDDWVNLEFLPNYKMFPYQSIINAKLSLDCLF